MKEKKKEVRRGREGPTLESTQVRAGPCQDCGQLGVGIWKGRQSKSVAWPGRFAKITITEKAPTRDFSWLKAVSLWLNRCLNTVSRDKIRTLSARGAFSVI